LSDKHDSYQGSLVGTGQGNIGLAWKPVIGLARRVGNRNLSPSLDGTGRGRNVTKLMNLRKATISSLLTLLAAAFVFAQTPPPAAKPLPTPKPADVASIGSIMKALYDVISGPIGQKRDWDRMRSLFVPDARMGAAVRTRTGDIRYFGFSVDRYVEMDDQLMTEKGFFEKELHRHADTFGNITQVFSTYESRWKQDDAKPFERGINSIQLMNDGKRWWIVSIFWQGEDDKLALPDQWLKG
jgi:hypothetical protein